MFLSLAGAVSLAVSLNVAYSVTVPSRVNNLEVPWKRTGLSGHVSRSDYKYPTDGCVHGPKSRSCWGDGFDISTDMDLKWPNTGKTVKYDFEITNVTLAPDGFEKPMMVVNGQYPGPTIVADWGDDIEVVVKNSLTINGTGIHWHGMRQLGSNEMDGVGGVTECPIAPGETKIYRFKATQYGSSWWHSHYSIQYGEGIVGGLIINGPSTKNYDIDLGILPFTDWFHAPLFTVNAAALRATGPPISDNLLVNGSMTSASGGQYAVTTLTPGKTHLLRLTNTGINNYVHVGLDGHKFTVIAADLTPIVPYETSSVVLAVGQRYDVLISANQTVGNYWLRVGTGGRCDGPNANAANIASIFRYDGASDSLPTSNATTPLPTGCYDETNLVPFIDTQIPQEVPDNLTVGFTNTAAESNLVQWTINGSPMLIDFTRPTIQQVIDGNTSYNQAENVFAIGEAHQFQYWVIQQSNTTPPLPHPIHLHGHDFFILESGSTPWTGDISRLKVDNPVRRDTATLPAGGYLVLAFESDNPGAWLMHCHIPFHVSAGFGLQFVERQDEILSKSVGDLQGFRDGCKSWATFQTEFWPDGFEQGDSGL